MSTLNANVFFELGIRTALDKPVALVRDQHTTKVPFDTNVINHHVYDGSLTPWGLQNEVHRLSEHLVKAVNTSGDRNALWRYFGLSTRANVPAPASVEDKLDIILDALTKASPAKTTKAAASDEEKVIALAQRVARKMNAEFDVVEVGTGKIVLDQTGYIIPPSDIERIRQFAKSKGVALSIQGGVSVEEFRRRVAESKKAPEGKTE